MFLLDSIFQDGRNVKTAFHDLLAILNAAVARDTVLAQGVELVGVCQGAY